MTTRSPIGPAESGLEAGPARADVRDLIAKTLDIDPVEVADSLSLHDLPEWSSLDHVTLMIALEDRFGVVIDGPRTADLVSVAAIERYIGEVLPSTAPGSGDGDEWPGRSNATTTGDVPVRPGPTIHRGLDGVHFDESDLTKIDGRSGELLLRGYPIEDIAEHADFAQVCHLILFGARPSAEEAVRMRNRLCRPGLLQPDAVSIVRSMADAHPMVALRTALSLIGSGGSGTEPPSSTAAADRGPDLVACSRQILAIHHRASTERRGSSSDPAGLTTDNDEPLHDTARFLRLFFASEPEPIEVEALDLTFRLQVDHGSNASAFAARVAAAAGADVEGAAVSALATFAGSLHGGAIEGVIEGLREIGHPGLAAAHVADRRARRLPVMGFGHRVYKVADPRSTPLRAMANRLAEHCGDWWALETMSAVEAAMAPYERYGFVMNVDSYAALIYHLLGFPDEYLTALYATARMAGWVAHIAEQMDHNVLIRPRLAYTGPDRRHWTAEASR